MPARFSHTSHVIENQLYLVGGVAISDQIFDNISVVDLNTSIWIKSIELNCLNPADILLLHGHTTAVVKNEEEGKTICIIGGGDNCFSFGTWFNKSPCSIAI